MRRFFSLLVAFVIFGISTFCSRQVAVVPNPTPQYGSPTDSNSSQVEIINEPFTIGKDTTQ